MVRPVWLERYSSRTRDPYVLLWGLPAMWDRHLGSNPAHVVALFVTTVVAGVPGVAGAPRPTCHMPCGIFVHSLSGDLLLEALLERPDCVLHHGLAVLL